MIHNSLPIRYESIILRGYGYLATFARGFGFFVWRSVITTCFSAHRTAFSWPETQQATRRRHIHHLDVTFVCCSYVQKAPRYREHKGETSSFVWPLKCLERWSKTCCWTLVTHELCMFSTAFRVTTTHQPCWKHPIQASYGNWGDGVRDKGLKGKPYSLCRINKIV